MEALILTITVIGITAVLIWLIVILVNEGEAQGYKKGQIDALNGKVKYQKEENEDGETVWTEIPTTPQ